MASLFVMMSLFHDWDHLLRIVLDRAFSLTCVYACAVLNGAWLFIWKCFSPPCNILINPNSSKLLGPPLIVVKLDKPGHLFHCKPRFTLGEVEGLQAADCTCNKLSNESICSREILLISVFGVKQSLPIHSQHFPSP